MIQILIDFKNFLNQFLQVNVILFLIHWKKHLIKNLMLIKIITKHKYQP